MLCSDSLLHCFYSSAPSCAICDILCSCPHAAQLPCLNAIATGLPFNCCSFLGVPDGAIACNLYLLQYCIKAVADTKCFAKQSKCITPKRVLRLTDRTEDVLQRHGLHFSYHCYRRLLRLEIVNQFPLNILFTAITYRQ